MAKKSGKKTAASSAFRFRHGLAAWLAEDGRTKAGLATTAGISRSHLDKILCGDCTPGIDLAERLAGACNMKLLDMLTAEPSTRRRKCS